MKIYPTFEGPSKPQEEPAQVAAKKLSLDSPSSSSKIVEEPPSEATPVTYGSYSPLALITPPREDPTVTLPLPSLVTAEPTISPDPLPPEDVEPPQSSQLPPLFSLVTSEPIILQICFYKRTLSPCSFRVVNLLHQFPHLNLSQLIRRSHSYSL